MSLCKLMDANWTFISGRCVYRKRERKRERERERELVIIWGIKKERSSPPPHLDWPDLNLGQKNVSNTAEDNESWDRFFFSRYNFSIHFFCFEAKLKTCVCVREQTHSRHIKTRWPVGRWDQLMSRWGQWKKNNWPWFLKFEGRKIGWGRIL